MGKVNFLHIKKSQKRNLIVVSVCLAVLCLGAIVMGVIRRDGGTDERSSVSADALVAQTTERLDKQLAKKVTPDERVSLLQAKISNYESVGKYDDALLSARLLAREFPDVAAYRAEVARLYGLKGDMQQQRRFYKEAITVLDGQPGTNEVTVERTYYESQLNMLEVGS